MIRTGRRTFVLRRRFLLRLPFQFSAQGRTQHGIKRRKYQYCIAYHIGNARDEKRVPQPQSIGKDGDKSRERRLLLPQGDQHQRTAGGAEQGAERESACDPFRDRGYQSEENEQTGDQGMIKTLAFLTVAEYHGRYGVDAVQDCRRVASEAEKGCDPEKVGEASELQNIFPFFGEKYENVFKYGDRSEHLADPLSS